MCDREGCWLADDECTADYHDAKLIGACTCEPYWQDAGGGYTELLAEPDPDCPEHFPAPQQYRPLGGIFLAGELYRETRWHGHNYWHWELQPDTRQILHKGKKPHK